MIDDTNGRIVTDLAGVAWEDVSAWVRDGPPVEHHLALVEGDRLAPSLRLERFPDPLGSSFGTMHTTPDGIVALILESPGGPAHAWRTVDGREWTDLGPWDITDRGGVFYMRILEDPFHAEHHLGDVLVKTWASTDGLHWEEVLKDPPPDSNLIRLTSGVLAQQWTDPGEAWWASADGVTWEPVDVSALDLELGQSDSSLGAVGDTAFVVVDDGSGRRDMWVLSFDTA